MARTTQELLERLFSFLPPDYETAEPLLAGLAAAMRDAEVAGDSLADVLPFGSTIMVTPSGQTILYAGAEGIWLDLHAAGYGLSRQPGETDGQLRARLREVADRVTRPAILAAVNNLLLPFAVTATMIEWWEEPYLDVEEAVAPGGMYLDSTFLSGLANTFILIVPVVGLGYSVSAGPYLNVDAFLDSMFVGTDVQDPVYAAIIALVETLRAAGIRWRLVIGDPPP